jgi:hypothetical protein
MNHPLSYYLEDTERLQQLDADQLRSMLESHPFDHGLRLLLAFKQELTKTHLTGNTSPAFTDGRMLTPEFIRLMDAGTSVSESIIYPSGMPESSSGISEMEVPMIAFENAPDMTGNNTYPEPENDNNYQSEIISDSYQDVSEKEEESDISDVLSNPDSFIINEPEMSALTDDSKELMPDDTPTIVPERDMDILQHDIAGESDSNKKSASKKKKKSKKMKSEKFRMKELNGLSEYGQWLLSISGKNIPGEKRRRKEKHAEVIESVKKSVQKSDQIISEPLAQILASQGHISEAVKMYNQLMLKFPEKSVYFAAKIEELLKNNLE